MCTFEVVGNGGQAGLQRGLGDPSPSHSPKSVRAFPSAKDLLDPASDVMDRAVPFGEQPMSLLLALGPNMRGDDTWFTAARAHRFAKDFAPIAAIGVNIARLIGLHGLAIEPIMSIARRDGQLLN